MFSYLIDFLVKKTNVSGPKKVAVSAPKKNQILKTQRNYFPISHMYLYDI